MRAIVAAALLACASSAAIAGPPPGSGTPAAFPLLPPANNRICVNEDSNGVIDWNVNPTGTAAGSIEQTRGVAFWVQMLSGQRVRFNVADNFAKAGDTTAQISVRTSQVVANSCAAVVYGGGTNDFPPSGTTLASTVTAINAADLAAMRAANKLVFLLAIPPRGTNAANVWTAAQAQNVAAVNQWRKAYAEKNPGVIFINAWDRIADQTSTTGAYLDGAVNPAETTHYTPYSSYWIGRLIASAVIQYYPFRDLLPASSGDVFDLTNNVTGAFNANPMMTGTGGTVGTSTSTVTGGSAGIAAGWTVDGSDSGVTVTVSKVTSTITGLPMQQLALGGTGSGTNYVRLYQAISTSGGKVTTGDSMEGVCAIEVDAGAVGLNGFRLEVNQTDANSVNTPVAFGDSGHTPGAYVPPVTFSGIMRTPVVTIGTTPLTVFQFLFRAYVASGQSISATIRIGQCKLYKLPS